MKKIILLFSVVWLVASLNGQNLVTNFSFEDVTPNSFRIFSQGEVTGWLGNGSSSTVEDSSICNNPYIVYKPQHMRRLAKVVLNNAIINQLVKPIKPYQVLNLNFWALVPACAYNQCYKLEFYLAKQAENNSSLFPSYIDPNNYRKIGEQDVWILNNQWRNYTLTSQPVTPLPNLCDDFKFLVIVPRYCAQELSGPDKNQTNSADAITSASTILDENRYILLDSISMTDCQAPANGISIGFTPDVDGICTKTQLSVQGVFLAGTHFLWNFGDGTCSSTQAHTTIHTYNEMGNYMVSVSIVDPYGCIKETRLLIKINCVRCQRINANFSATCQQCTPLYGPNPKFPNELVIVGYDCTYNLTDLSSPGSLNSQIVSWEWFRNGTDLFSTAQNPTVTLNSGETFPSQQTICLRVRDSNGCIDYFCQSFWVPCNGNSGGRPALGNGEKPTVFPNPTTGTVDVALPAEYSNTTGQILVYNLSGSLIQQVAFDGGQKYYPVDLSNQSGGVYLIRIQAGEYNSVQKVILQK